MTAYDGLVTHFTAVVPHTLLRICEQTQAKDETHSELGLVGQSLITALRNELTEYYRLLSILEAQLKSGMMGLTLHQLSVYTMEPMERMKLLATIVKTCGR